MQHRWPAGCHRLAPRGVAVNSWGSGPSRGARLNKRQGRAQRLIYPVARWFTRSVAQRAATAALLAASPLVAGISGEYWSNCQITHGNPLLADEIFAKRFWDASERTVTAIRATRQIASRPSDRLRGDERNRPFNAIGPPVLHSRRACSRLPEQRCQAATDSSAHAGRIASLRPR
jgi:hypothetical protein